MGYPSTSGRVSVNPLHVRNAHPPPSAVARRRPPFHAAAPSTTAHRWRP
jgi:hypothetical protein